MYSLPELNHYVERFATFADRVKMEPIIFPSVNITVDLPKGYGVGVLVATNFKISTANHVKD